jgi:hypothetical protein
MWALSLAQQTSSGGGTGEWFSRGEAAPGQRGQEAQGLEEGQEERQEEGQAQPLQPGVAGVPSGKLQSTGRTSASPGSSVLKSGLVAVLAAAEEVPGVEPSAAPGGLEEDEAWRDAPDDMKQLLAALASAPAGVWRSTERVPEPEGKAGSREPALGAAPAAGAGCGTGAADVPALPTVLGTPKRPAFSLTRALSRLVGVRRRPSNPGDKPLSQPSTPVLLRLLSCTRPSLSRGKARPTGAKPAIEQRSGLPEQHPCTGAVQAGQAQPCGPGHAPQPTRGCSRPVQPAAAQPAAGGEGLVVQAAPGCSRGGVPPLDHAVVQLVRAPHDDLACALATVDSWTEFSAFALDQAAGGHALSVLAFALLRRAAFILFWGPSLAVDGQVHGHLAGGGGPAAPSSPPHTRPSPFPHHPAPLPPSNQLPASARMRAPPHAGAAASHACCSWTRRSWPGACCWGWEGGGGRGAGTGWDELRRVVDQERDPIAAPGVCPTPLILISLLPLLPPFTNCRFLVAVEAGYPVCGARAHGPGESRAAGVLRGCYLTPKTALLSSARNSPPVPPSHLPCARQDNP